MFLFLLAVKNIMNRKTCHSKRKFIFFINLYAERQLKRNKNHHLECVISPERARKAPSLDDELQAKLF